MTAKTTRRPRLMAVPPKEHAVMQKLRLLQDTPYGWGREERWLSYLCSYEQQQRVVMPPYTPSSAKMRAFHAALATIRVIFGGNGSGKTEGGAYDMVRFIAQHPGCVAWACGVTYDAIGEYIWPKIQKYLPQEVLRTAKIAWISSARDIPAIVRLPFFANAEIRFKSYEQGRRKLQGAAVDYAWLDEEPSLEIFNEIVARVARKRGKIILTMTPLMGLTWAYDKIESAPADDPLIWKTRIATGENQFFPQEELEMMIRTYGTDEAVRRIAGEFMQPAGAIWKEWRVERNVVPPFDLSPDEPCIMGIDFGFSAPFAATWTVRRDNKYYVIAEYQKNNLLIEDHVAALRAKYGELLRRTTAIFADPESAENRAALKKAFPGIAVKPAQNAWQVGIDTVNRALKSRHDTTPALMVFSSCKQVIYAASQYRFKPNSDKPLNNESHLPDTIRYQMMHYLKPDPSAPQWSVSKQARVFGGNHGSTTL